MPNCWNFNHFSYPFGIRHLISTASAKLRRIYSNATVRPASQHCCWHSSYTEHPLDFFKHICNIFFSIRSLKKAARHVRKSLLRASEFQKLFIQKSLSTLHSSAAGYVLWVCLYCHYLGSDLRCSFFQYTATRQSMKMQVFIRQFVRTRSDVSVCPTTCRRSND